jgi:hypothetical protein
MLSPFQQPFTMNAYCHQYDQLVPFELWDKGSPWPGLDNMDPMIQSETYPPQLPTTVSARALGEIPEAITDDEPVSSTSEGTTCRSQKAPTRKNWDLYRPTMVQLYIDEDHTLLDIMHFMQTEHNFKATKKTYKSRLTAWNVRKYMTRAEREVACRVMKLKHRNGEALGNIIIRGKERNPDVFLRHMGQSRTGDHRRRLLHNGAALNETDIVINGFESRSLHLIAQSPMYPAGPEKTIAAISKELTHLTLARSKAPKPYSYTLAMLLGTALRRSQSGYHQDARILLNRAAEWFRIRVASQPARALLSLLSCQQISETFSPALNTGGFSETFYRNILEVIRVFYGPQHSLVALNSQIVQLRSEPMAGT